MTTLFAIAAVVLAAMIVACVVLGEPQNVPGFVIASLISGAIALVLRVIFPAPADLELRHAMVMAALAYLVVPAICVIPFVMIEHMSPLDAYFESISGWTCSGMSMIPAPESASHSILLWRSVTEWIGGIGVILLMVTILIRPGTSTYVMYQSESRKEKIRPSIRSTMNMIWFLYLMLTLLGIIMLALVGMPLWDAINTGMVTIGTGGFSLHSDSVAYYDSVPIEIATMAIMVMGALPFVFLYRSIKNPKSLQNLDPEVKAFFLIMVIGVLALSGEIYLTQGNLGHSLRIGMYQFVSTITGTGFTTVDIAGWSYSALMILSIGAIIGGCAGSTASGLKVARVVFMVKEFELWMKRTLLPRNAIVTLRIGNKRLSEDAVGKELSEAALITFLYLISILLSVMVLSHVVPPEYDLSVLIFSVCSAQGNLGMSTDMIGPGMHYLGKILFMTNMWIGRLEIIPVTLLVRYLIKGFRI